LLNSHGDDGINPLQGNRRGNGSCVPSPGVPQRSSNQHHGNEAKDYNVPLFGSGSKGNWGHTFGRQDQGKRIKINRDEGSNLVHFFPQPLFQDLRRA
jgi:hypothetical protein